MSIYDWIFVIIVFADFSSSFFFSRATLLGITLFWNLRFSVQIPMQDRTISHARLFWWF